MLRVLWYDAAPDAWPMPEHRALQSFTDATAVDGSRYTYAASALERVANESRQ